MRWLHSDVCMRMFAEQIDIKRTHSTDVNCYSSSTPICDFVYLVCASLGVCGCTRYSTYLSLSCSVALSFRQVIHANSVLTPNETVIIRSCVIGKQKPTPTTQFTVVANVLFGQNLPKCINFDNFQINAKNSCKNSENFPEQNVCVLAL